MEECAVNSLQEFFLYPNYDSFPCSQEQLEEQIHSLGFPADDWGDTCTKFEALPIVAVLQSLVDSTNPPPAMITLKAKRTHDKGQIIPCQLKISMKRDNINLKGKEIQFLGSMDRKIMR
ncbi:UPF3 [Lepeophtheirus salmonis]|uniref:UPF3 n=1 Tax=Lepeophtheirus salmonis TaxID=72036 RepID=A0A7R8CAM0_LEPSM|nr:UPF3 [Lepeophtheirus salmonis]CAF2749957.1 UPF3 [Lepeophtheirus salmonis]